MNIISCPDNHPLFPSMVLPVVGDVHVVRKLRADTSVNFKSILNLAQAAGKLKAFLEHVVRGVFLSTPVSSPLSSVYGFRQQTS